MKFNIKKTRAGCQQEIHSPKVNIAIDGRHNMTLLVSYYGKEDGRSEKEINKRLIMARTTTIYYPAEA